MGAFDPGVVQRLVMRPDGVWRCDPCLAPLHDSLIHHAAGCAAMAGPQPVTPAVIGPGLAKELEGYRGRWVAVVGQHVVADAETATGAVRALAGGDRAEPHPDPLVFRVPTSLAAFLGIGQGG